MDILERFVFVQRKNKQEAFACPHILVAHCGIFFLACSVQNVQNAGFAIDKNLMFLHVGIVFVIGLFNL
jgi:hypothetical protein